MYHGQLDFERHSTAFKIMQCFFLSENEKLPEDEPELALKQIEDFVKEVTDSSANSVQFFSGIACLCLCLIVGGRL